MSSSSSPFSGSAPWYMVSRSSIGLAPAPVAATAAGERGEVGVNCPKSAVKAASHCWAALRKAASTTGSSAAPGRVHSPRGAYRKPTRCRPTCSYAARRMCSMCGASRVGTSRCILARRWPPWAEEAQPLANSLSTSRIATSARIEAAVYAAEARFQPSCRKGRMSCSTAHVTLWDAMLTRMSATGSTSCAA